MLQFTLIVLCSWTMAMVLANPITSIECDCSSTSLESETTACCIGDWPLDASARITFRNVPNASQIIQFKVQSTANFSEIPSQIIDTFDNLQYLELTIGLERLPLSRLPGKLKHLNLGDNRITSIDIDSFRNAPDLEQINVQFNQIGSLADSGAFNRLGKLKHLIMYHNRLTVLKRNMFSDARDLQSLDVGANEIVCIEDGTFDLPHLREILLNENKIKTLSDRMFAGATSMQNLDLQKNALEHIGKAFDTMQHLHQLQLSENRHLKNLNVLDLTAKLPALISLNVDATGIRSLNPTASNATPTHSLLHTLSVSQNHLSQTDFLKHLSVYSKLEKLFVDANKFTCWDDSDVRSIKTYFPHIELIVTKNNAWDRSWVDNTLIPVFQTNSIFCSNIKYLNTYIEGFTNSVDGQIIDGTECI